FLTRISATFWKWPVRFFAVYCVGVNIFQIGQYNKTVLHFYDMNRLYYAAIYLNPNPSPLQYSLLDNTERLKNEARFHKSEILNVENPITIDLNTQGDTCFLQKELYGLHAGTWLRCTLDVKNYSGVWGSYLSSTLQGTTKSKSVKVRMFTPGSVSNSVNTYSWEFEVPENFENSTINFRVETDNNFHGEIKRAVLHSFSKN